MTSMLTIRDLIDFVGRVRVELKDAENALKSDDVRSEWTADTNSRWRAQGSAFDGTLIAVADGESESVDWEAIARGLAADNGLTITSQRIAAHTTTKKRAGYLRLDVKPRKDVAAASVAA